MENFNFRKEYYDVIKNLNYDYKKKDVIQAILIYCFDNDNFDIEELNDSERPLVELIIKLIDSDSGLKEFYWYG